MPVVQARADASAEPSFVPVQGRLLDSRTGVGGWSSPISNGQQRTVMVAGRFGIPTSAEIAVILSLTSLNASGSGWLSVAPSGTPPAGTAITFNVGDTVSNSSIVKLGGDGQISITAGGAGTGLVIDVQGYFFTAGSNSTYVPVRASRIMDTRIGLGAPRARLNSGEVLTASLPSDLVPGGAVAIFATITVVSPSVPGWVTAFAAGSSRPAVGGLSFDAPSNRALSTWIQTGPQSAVSLDISGGGSTDIIVDVQGYLRASEPGASDRFVPGAGRLHDTRSTHSPIPPGGSVTIPIVGRFGAPGSADELGSAVFSLTTVNTTNTGSGYLRVWATDEDPPPVSSALNYDSSNLYATALCVSGVGGYGAVVVQNNGPTEVDVVVDLIGWFAQSKIVATSPVEAPVGAPTKQALVTDFNTWIADLPESERKGYVQSYDDAELGTVRLDWNGDASKASSIIAEGERRGLVVSLRQVSYSVADLDAIAALGFQVSETTTGDPVKVVSVDSLPGDGGPPVLYVMPDSGQGGPRRSPAAVIAGGAYPAISFRTMPAAGNFGRNTDFSPFYAGGYMVTSGGSTCSVGFSIKYHGVYRSTTARHCLAGVTYYGRNSARSYGKAGVSNAAGGQLLGATGAGHVWVGPYDTTRSVPVRGLRVSQPGDYVCTEGGNSGERCWLRVTSGWFTYGDGYGNTFRVRSALKLAGGGTFSAGAQGDSGGPVVQYTSNGVNAVGMIQGAAGTVWPAGHANCRPIHDPYSSCASGVYYTDFRDFLNAYGGVGAGVDLVRYVSPPL